jgi:hypothetical protein
VPVNGPGLDLLLVGLTEEKVWSMSADIGHQLETGGCLGYEVAADFALRVVTIFV